MNVGRELKNNVFFPLGVRIHRLLYYDQHFIFIILDLWAQLPVMMAVRSLCHHLIYFFVGEQ